MSQPFIATIKWHLKVLATLLVICVIAYMAMAYITRHFPHPYQHKQPAREITPWLN